MAHPNSSGVAVGGQPEIYIYKDRQQYGPFPESTLREWLRTGQCTANDLGWRAGMKDWQPLATFFQSQDAAQSPVVPLQEPPSSRNETSMESRAAGEATSRDDAAWSLEEHGALITADLLVTLSRSGPPDSHIAAVRSRTWGIDLVVVVNATEGKIIESFEAKAEVKDLRFSHDGNQLAVCLWSIDHDVEGFILTAKSKQRIRFANPRSRGVFGPAWRGSKISAFTADDRFLTVANEEGRVTIMALSDIAALRTLPISAELESKQLVFTTTSLEWSPDGNVLAQAGWGQPLTLRSGNRYAGVLLWKFEKGVQFEMTGSKADVLEYPSDFTEGELRPEVPLGMAFLQGSQLLAVGSEHSGRASTIKVFDLKTHTLLCESKNIGSRTTTLVQSPRENCFFSGGVDGVLRMWRLNFEGGTAELSQISSCQFRSSVLQCLFCTETNSLLVAHDVGGKEIAIQHLRPPLELTESSVATRKGSW